MIFLGRIRIWFLGTDPDPGFFLTPPRSATLPGLGQIACNAHNNLATRLQQIFFSPTSHLRAIILSFKLSLQGQRGISQKKKSITALKTKGKKKQEGDWEKQKERTVTKYAATGTSVDTVISNLAVQNIFFREKKYR